MLLGVPLAIWFGFVALIFLIITLIFGAGRKYFKQKGFKYHILFAIISIVLLIIHVILAVSLWFFGIVV